MGRYGRRTVLSLIAEVSSFAGAFVDDAMVGIYSPSAVAFGGVQRDSFAVAFETPVVNGDQHGAVTGSQFVDGVCTGVHRCARGVQGCARGVHVVCTGVHVVCTWSARGVHVGCKDVHVGCKGVHMGCTWCAQGVHGVCTVCARGMHVECTWCARNVHVLCTWCARALGGQCGLARGRAYRAGRPAFFQVVVGSGREERRGGRCHHPGG